MSSRVSADAEGRGHLGRGLRAAGVRRRNAGTSTQRARGVLSGREPPLIAHIIHRLDVGGLENGLVNLINRLPPGHYRHVIVCLTSYSADFRQRIERDVPVLALHKREGKDLGLFVRLWQVLRRLRADLVHTRNLATLEAQLPAFLAGVRHRVHGEHGHDVHDLDNTSRKYRWLRVAYRPLVDRYVPLSSSLEAYLRREVRVPPRKISRICNGVDVARYHPAGSREDRAEVLPPEFIAGRPLVIGTVGRLEPVKDQLSLARAFIDLVGRYPDGKERFRLVIVGDGSLHEQIVALLAGAGVSDSVWMAGRRHDVPACYRALDIFVLPSLGEGISNTILEAMASGLPVIATDVGGNSELVVEGENGFLVPRRDAAAIVDRLECYAADPALLRAHSECSRRRAESEFSIDRMVEGYVGLYDRLLFGPNPGR